MHSSTLFCFSLSRNINAHVPTITWKWVTQELFPIQTKEMSVYQHSCIYFCFSLCLMTINANVLVPSHEALLSRKSLWFSLHQPMPCWGESTVPCPLMMMCTSSFFQWGVFCNQATETDGDSSLILGGEWVIWHQVYTLWNVISVGTDNTSQGPWHPPSYGCTLCQY